MVFINSSVNSRCWQVMRCAVNHVVSEIRLEFQYDSIRSYTLLSGNNVGMSCCVWCVLTELGYIYTFLFSNYKEIAI